jgi:rsbT co-antagonist protein RsbR
VLSKYQNDILTDWLKEQAAPDVIRDGLLREGELKDQSREFLRLLAMAVRSAESTEQLGPEFDELRALLSRLSRSRSERGFSPSETATFVFSLKRPLFSRLRREMEGEPSAAVFQEVWIATALLDKLGLYTTEVYQKTREDVIVRQQGEMLELSTPVVKLWDGILALPLIGTLDSNRTQVVMETLLQRIVETSSEVVIVDITGVPTVDTLVAQHLIKTVAAARLMGVECIISGIRPQIAQTIVHLGVDLGNMITKGNMADAFRVALQRRGVRLDNRGT